MFKKYQKVTKTYAKFLKISKLKKHFISKKKQHDTNRNFYKNCR